MDRDPFSTPTVSLTQWKFENQKNSSKSASRALDILEHFGLQRRPLRAKEIGDALDIGASSIDQLLKTMVRSGYLLFDPLAKAYHPSPRLNRFAAWLVEDGAKMGNLHALLEDIASRTRGFVSLLARSGHVMRLMDAVTGDVSLPVIIGLPIPFWSNGGIAFLATCPAEEADRIIDRAAQFREIPMDSAKALGVLVRKARSAGFASGQAIQDDFWSVAVALPHHAASAGGTLILSITEPGIEMEAHADKVAAYLLARADAMLGQMPL